MTNPPFVRAWRWRAQVLLAMLLLVPARILVGTVRLSLWRGSLGRLASGAPPKDAPLAETAASSAHLRALRLGRGVDRAAALLPFPVRCLPRAVALQWLMRLCRLPARLVVAVHVTDRSGEHAYHAWVEHDGAMIIGQCDRRRYRPVMTFHAAAGGGGAR